ncbi:peptidylprolyl isomerase [Hyphomonas sp.]|uniref:peptidylprolyl isomerase n=1 Tax=Hyphomonas sp. TaxID=87 RepID=UPI00391AE5F5
MKRALALTALAVAACTSGPASLAEAPVATAAPAWRPVDAENLVLMELPTGTVAVELFPEAAPAHVARLRELLAEGFYDGEFFYRVIEGHVAQAGREFAMSSKAWQNVPFEAERAVSAEGFAPLGNADLFAPEAGHRSGFTVGRDGEQEWLLNCPGALGMARDEAPDTGNTEIYFPLQPRRYLDRNYTIFGRVIAGMEHLHRLPRVDPFTDEEAAALFGEDEPLAYQMAQYRRSKNEYNIITSAKLAASIPEGERPSYEVMDTASADWAALKESKRDYSGIAAFIAPPVNMLDICSLPVPARKAGD